MKKCVLFIEYHLFMPDVRKLLVDGGYALVGLQAKDLSVERFNAACDAHRPQWLFSINFSPEIAYLCSTRGLPYVSWTIDPLPHNRLALIDGTKPSALAWYLKERILPPMYWEAMLKGREWLAQPEMKG